MRPRSTRGPASGSRSRARPWIATAAACGSSRRATPSRARTSDSCCGAPPPTASRPRGGAPRASVLAVPGDRLEQALVAPDVALDEAVRRPRLVDEHAVAADLDVEADRA